MCTLCYVDDAMKKNIAAQGATFREATKSPFGASDEIGMLNLITADSRDAIMSTALPNCTLAQLAAMMADRTEDVRLRGDQIATARWIFERRSVR